MKKIITDIKHGIYLQEIDLDSELYQPSWEWNIVRIYDIPIQK